MDLPRRPLVCERTFMTRTLLTLSLAATLLGACASRGRLIRGTQIKDEGENRKILQTVEQYRLAMERRDAPALLAMASKSYWEDGGTPMGGDDYGYDGLREVLIKSFSRAEQVRYSVRYMDLIQEPDHVKVDVLIDASFTVQTARGPQRLDMRDQNQLVLKNENGRWLIVSGM
jgi:hypothetical protein